MRVSRLTSCPLACVRKRVPQLDDLVQCAACACVRRLRRRGVVFCTSDVVSNKLFCGMLIQIPAGAYRCGRLFGCGGVRDFLCLAVHTRVFGGSERESVGVHTGQLQRPPLAGRAII